MSNRPGYESFELALEFRILQPHDFQGQYYKEKQKKYWGKTRVGILVVPKFRFHEIFVI